MNEAEHAHVADASKQSACGCSAGSAAQKVLDPVCGMTVDPASSKPRFEHQGETFHFCSAGCRTRFAADPANAGAVIGALLGAGQACLSGELHGVVTGPVHKAVINEGGIA